MAEALQALLHQIIENTEKSQPIITAAGSEEQQQLLAAMHITLLESAPQYAKLPPSGGEALFIWRHDMMRPVSLCINSAELMLTDKHPPLPADARPYIQQVFDLTLKLSARIDQIFSDRGPDD
jgi:hypothetical protein